MHIARHMERMHKEKVDGLVKAEPSQCKTEPPQ